MNLFKEKTDMAAVIRSLRETIRPRANVPTDLFVKCSRCQHSDTEDIFRANYFICPVCGHHLRISAQYRLKLVCDDGQYHEINRKLIGKDPLMFPDYDKKLKELRASTDLEEAVITAVGTIGGVKTVLACLDSRFLMGSMGTAVGEKITRAIEYATKNRLPLIIFSASGGARMQEGIYSLMQMAKTSAALARHDNAGLLFISVLTHPTTGGVTASFASLGDIILAEPDALIGFAGPRVIEQTIKQKLPDGFQRSEFQQAQGFVDHVVPRNELRETLQSLLRMHCGRPA